MRQVFDSHDIHWMIYVRDKVVPNMLPWFRRPRIHWKHIQNTVAQHTQIVRTWKMLCQLRKQLFIDSVWMRSLYDSEIWSWVYNTFVHCFIQILYKSSIQKQFFL